MFSLLWPGPGLGLVGTGGEGEVSIIIIMAPLSICVVGAAAGKSGVEVTPQTRDRPPAWSSQYCRLDIQLEQLASSGVTQSRRQTGSHLPFLLRVHQI